jgi:hypothetical protein
MIPGNSGQSGLADSTRADSHAGVTTSQHEAGVKSPLTPMARSKTYDYSQTRLIPGLLEHQLLQGTFAQTIHLLVEQKMELSLFDQRSNNDETGCPASDPKILLKVILFAYSRGLIGSRRIEWLCQHHGIGLAFACMQSPDHSTIAACVSSMPAEMLSLCCDGLLVGEEQQVLGGPVFALDGLKLPSKASKAWSGTLEELHHKQAKLEAKIAQFLAEHQQADAEEPEGVSPSGSPQHERGEGDTPRDAETPSGPPQPEDVQATGSGGADAPNPREAIQSREVDNGRPTRSPARGPPSGRKAQSKSRKQKGRTTPRRKPKKSKK